MNRGEILKNGLYSLLFAVVFFLLNTGGRMIFASSEDIADYAGPSQSLFNLRIPKDLQFAGEPIPKDDYSIKESMERVINGGKFEKSTAYVLFSRASAWFPLIEAILKRNHIPDDFKYIALEESRLTNSISPRGAVGFWQFVQATGSYYGLEINEDVDERYHVEKSTEAACRYFRDAYKKFHNWTLAAASYNLGMGGIEYHLKKQGSDNYYDLMMNKETSNYVYKILALKTILVNSGKKFRGGGNIYNMAGVTCKTDSSISDLSAFARSKGISLETLKMFNPWLVGTKLSNSAHKTYYIKLPGKDYLRTIAAAAADSSNPGKDTMQVASPAADTSAIITDTLKEKRNE